MKPDYFDFAKWNSQNAGPQWGAASDDLNVTLLSWPEGEGTPESVNAEVDVAIVVLDGQGEARVDDLTFELRPGCALLIPKGALRSIVSTSARLNYFSIHRRRAGLQIQSEPRA